MSEDIWEAYAVAYGRHDRPSSENFIGGDLHHGPVPLTSYVWVLRNGTRTVVIASATAHHYAHLQRQKVFPTVDSVPTSMRAIDAFLHLAKVTSPGSCQGTILLFQPFIPRFRKRPAAGSCDWTSTPHPYRPRRKRPILSELDIEND